MRLSVVYCALMVTVVASSDQNNQQVEVKYRDCHERWEMNKELIPAVYTIHPNGTYPVKVFCEHGVNGTSTLIQRRSQGTVSFAQPLTSYINGFGNSLTDFWTGLTNIHYLTATGNSVLRITLQDWKGQVRSATYKTFLVADQLHKFRLTIGGFQGNVPDAMSYNNQMDFHAYDYPDAKGCATQQRAGWWYNYCTHALLNGHYYTGGAYTPGAMCDGVYWNGWYTCDYSLKYVAMTLSRN